MLTCAASPSCWARRYPSRARPPSATSRLRSKRHHRRWIPASDVERRCAPRGEQLRAWLRGRQPSHRADRVCSILSAFSWAARRTTGRRLVLDARRTHRASRSGTSSVSSCMVRSADMVRTDTSCAIQEPLSRPLQTTPTRDRGWLRRCSSGESVSSILNAIVVGVRDRQLDEVLQACPIRRARSR